MTLPDIRTWIANQPERSAADGVNALLHDPNTGAVLTESLSSSHAQVDRAIAAAHAAHQSGDWWRLGIAGRTPYLLALATELDALGEQIAGLDALNSGVPISITRLFAGSNGDTIRTAIARASAAGDSELLVADHGEVRVHRVPWGATAVILPWNAPAPMAVKKLAFAIATGAAVVLKPSPESPFSAQLIMEAIVRAGLPAGVANLVTGGGPVGAQLTTDHRIRAIAMTGSTATGRIIAAATAPRFTRLHLELGSNNVAIVRADAHIASAAKAVVDGALKLSGQWCEAPRRIVVDSTIIGDFTNAVHSELANWTIGSSLDDKTQLGPVAYRGRLEQLRSQREALRDAGHQIITVGAGRALDRFAEGWFFEPTIALGRHAQLPTQFLTESATQSATESAARSSAEISAEIFGPMLIIEPSFGDAEAVRQANDGQVGLAGYVFSADEDAARAIGIQLDAGEVKVNGTSVLDMAAESSQSFFGSSGIGGHGDADLLSFFTGKRIVGTDRPGLPL